MRSIVVQSAVLFACFLPLRAVADVKFTTALFSDGMVLQRQMPDPIWGQADPGESVAVSIDGQSKTTEATTDGNWRVILDPMEAGGPYDLIVTGQNTVVVHNVMVGEIWLASGQSNMANDKPRYPILAQYPSVRTFKRRGWADKPGGTAFWFGAELSGALGVSVGLLNEAVASTTIERWLGPSVTTDPDPDVRNLVGSLGPIFGSDYNARITPLEPYAIRGAIWWQGESNTPYPGRYSHLFPGLIRSWRQAWGEGDFPFLFVQLPTGGGLQPGEIPAQLPTNPPTGDLLPLFANAYFQTLAVPNTGMVISVDLPRAYHPLDKRDYGVRFARLALSSVYGQTSISSGPVLESMTREGSRLRLHFRAHTATGLHALGSGAVQGFSIAGPDGIFAWATAQIEGEEVVVWNDGIPVPASVRYAWADLPNWANLFNDADLGAAIFGSDYVSPTPIPAATATPTPARTP